ncbi:hypothetical protein GJ496_004511 [Pomphorhynchus laevis]|nr:hypothetical protein GJ496_004511 [Pomphorhynchus laevis]
MVYEGLKPFISGGVASVCGEFVSFPFDLTKTRLQLQGQVIDASLKQIKYRGMIHAFLTIAKEEGILALYNGFSPAVLRQATYGPLKMGFYNYAKRLIIGNKNDTLFYNIICGMLAGGCAGFIANPTDLLKVRLQAAKTTKSGPKMSLLAYFVNIYQKEGFLGLYRGSIQTFQRQSIVTGVELGVYDCSKRYIIRNNLGTDNIVTHFCASVVAGFAATLATNPIDVVRTRLMNQRKLINPTSGKPQALYRNSMDCIRQTIASEGFFALYKGFFPLWLRLAPWNTTFFIVYEKMQNML